MITLPAKSTVTYVRNQRPGRGQARARAKTERAAPHVEKGPETVRTEESSKPKRARLSGQWRLTTSCASCHANCMQAPRPTIATVGSVHAEEAPGRTAARTERCTRVLCTACERRVGGRITRRITRRMHASWGLTFRGYGSGRRSSLSALAQRWSRREQRAEVQGGRVQGVLRGGARMRAPAWHSLGCRGGHAGHAYTHARACAHARRHPPRARRARSLARCRRARLRRARACRRGEGN